MAKKNPYRAGGGISLQDIQPLAGWIGYWVRTFHPDMTMLTITLTPRGAGAIAAIGGQRWLEGYLAVVAGDKMLRRDGLEIRLEDNVLLVSMPGNEREEIMVLLDRRSVLVLGREEGE